MIIKKIKKRDGRIVNFDQSKITAAIWKAAEAVGGNDRQRAKYLSDKVVEILNKNFSQPKIATVEHVQDVVERVLMRHGHYTTAKAYILYRDLHNKIRDVKSLIDSEELVGNYVNGSDWRIKENSNMAYSLQGLNNHVASEISKAYWLNQLYPKEARNAHQAGEIHIHDLSILAPYCVGWDLYDFLLKGFTGVAGKVACSPPRHLATALGQLVNFFYTLQGESAGANAVSSFDTLLAPFVWADKLTHREVKQAMQAFIFNMNVPTRVGFQCFSEDTEILTSEGWKKYDEIKKGMLIKTLNVKKKIIENKKVKSIFKKKYHGMMYNLKNRIQDQLISPQHRVVRKKFQTENYVLEPIEEVLKLKSPVIIPVAADNIFPEASLSDEQIKLMAWVVGEGSLERPGKHRGCYHVSIYQSAIKNKKNYEEIKSLLGHFKLKYSEYTQHGLGEPVQRLRLNIESSKIIHQWFSKENIKFIPEILFSLNEGQSKLFLATYIKVEGFEGSKIAVSDVEILDSLQMIAVNAGYGSTILARKSTIGSKIVYVLRLIEHKETYIQEIEKVKYTGIIWCPNTENETVVARRNGKVFITGNTPFTNITMDLTAPSTLKDQAAVVGGEPVNKTYGEFQKEMGMINRAFAEVMAEGDADGRVFTFPIPTYNITKDFDWTNPTLNAVWQMTAKYGIPYFSNFVNSDMKPEDARSMCCRLRLDSRELRKRGGGLFGSNPLTGCYDEKTEILTEGGWKFFKDLNKNDCVFTLAENNEIELYQPKKLFKYDYKGEMLHFKTKSLDLLVTPNHRMVIDQTGSGKRKFVEASDFDVNNQRIPKQSVWRGKEKEWFILPSIEFTKYGRQGRTTYQVTRETLKVKMDSWLKFFGFWLAEGCTDNEKIAKSHGYRVAITQIKKETRKEIKKILNVLPFNYAEEKNNFVICNKQLWIYLRQFGKKYDKFIPQEIKVLSKRQLKILFDWMIKGDGHVRKTTGQINYWTTSKKLVDDLQEIVLKLGWLATSVGRKKTGIIKGRKINSGLCYTIGIQKAKHYRLRKNNIKKIFYQGKVYCCEVKNHAVFVRRNGKVSWCGNSIGVVTINMARIGYLSKSKKEFLNKLSKLMEISRNSLLTKRQVLERLTDQGLYPYSRFYLQGIKDRFGSFWKNHFNTIGLLGMNEGITNLLKTDIGTSRGQGFAINVLDFMRDRLAEFQKEDNELFNLEATPGEGTTYRFASLDKKFYPKIMVANEKEIRTNGAKPYYTNSTQLPVGYTDDIFEALDLQDELQTKYTGGTVLHGFLGESLADGQMAKILVKKIANNYHLPYYTLSPTFSVCQSHGYLRGEKPVCPECGSSTEVFSRVVGYIRPVQQWNPGKQSEFESRKAFKV